MIPITLRALRSTQRGCPTIKASRGGASEERLLGQVGFLECERHQQREEEDQTVAGILPAAPVGIHQPAADQQADDAAAENGAGIGRRSHEQRHNSQQVGGNLDRKQRKDGGALGETNPHSSSFGWWDHRSGSRSNNPTVGVAGRVGMVT
jgi:hypothetical protein